MAGRPFRRFLARTDLAIEREGYLTTEKRAERTKLDFLCPIWSSAISPANTAAKHTAHEHKI